MNKDYQRISEYIDSQQENMLSDYMTLVSLEGHSTERENVEKALAFYVEELRKAGVTDIRSFEIAQERAPLVCAVWGAERKAAPVILSSHFDTVHFSGTFADPAVRLEGDLLHGPGAKDCKGGGIIMLYILKALMHIGYNDRPIKLILISDEEECHRGSAAQEIILRESQGALCAFNLEPGDMFHRLVTARKTSYQFELAINGVSGHAGNAFFEARNPINEAACKLIELVKLNDLSLGTTIAPTVIHAGRQFSTIPGQCTLSVNARFNTDAEAERITREVMRIAQTSYTPDTHTDVITDISYLPAYPESAEITRMFDFTNALAVEIGMEPFGKVHRGGASDAGNFMKAGVPTLDGCGVTGDGGHTTQEYGIVSSLYSRSKLFTYVLTRIDEIARPDGSSIQA